MADRRRQRPQVLADLRRSLSRLANRSIMAVAHFRRQVVLVLIDYYLAGWRCLSGQDTQLAQVLGG